MSSVITLNTSDDAVLTLPSSIRELVELLNSSAAQIAVVVDKDGSPIATVTDGDVRRGLIAGLSLSDSVLEIMNTSPIVAAHDLPLSSVSKLMASHEITKIPAVDESGKLVGIFEFRLDIDSVSRAPMVILAGGFGTRLRPFTDNRPKPLVHMEGRPIIEHIIERAKDCGFTDFYLLTHYKSEMLKDHLGDGSAFGVNVTHIVEDVPLGTAGGLGKLKGYFESPFLVTNGDVITDINYADFLRFHVHSGAHATIATKKHQMQNPYGVLEIEGSHVFNFIEKPVITSNISAGIYAFSSCVFDVVNSDTHCDMPDLLRIFIDAKMVVGAYPLWEEWADIGRPEDLRF